MTARPIPALAEAPAAPAAEDHRSRLLDAATTVFSRCGYAAATVPEIAAAAGLSTADFHRHFSDKEDCFLAAYDAASGRIEEWARAALAGWSGGWAAGVQRAVAVTADLLAVDPRIGRLCGVEAFLAGPRGLARHRALVDRLAPALAAGRRERPPAAADLPAELERDLLGGAILSLGRADRPADLVPEVTYCLLAPYLGVADARRLALA